VVHAHSRICTQAEAGSSSEPRRAPGRRNSGRERPG
jgi:hypothetical protein